MGKNASTPKKLTTQSIHFSRNFLMVVSDPCKFDEIFNEFLFKVSVFLKIIQYKVSEKVAAYRRFWG